MPCLETEVYPTRLNTSRCRESLVGGWALRSSAALEPRSDPPVHTCMGVSKARQRQLDTPKTTYIKTGLQDHLLPPLLPIEP